MTKIKHKLTALAATGALVAVTLAPVSAAIANPLSNSSNDTFLLAKKESKLLKNIRVSETLEDGSTLEGKVTITEFDYNETDGLLASGVLKGEIVKDGTTTDFKQTFTDIPADLSTSETALAKIGNKQTSCDILFLDLGPIFLDVLGLTVDLSEIILDIDAVAGSGNLLGNLLCSLVSLLDGPGTLLQILDLIGQINDLL